MKTIDDQLTRAFLEALTTTSRRLKTLFDARVTEHGLTYARGRALLLLVQYPGLTQRELACKLELEQATVVRLLDRMEEHNLIHRVPDDHDRRAKKLQLTPQGEEGGKLVKSIGEAIRQEVFGDIPNEDLRNAIATMNAVSDRMGEKDS